MPFTFFAHQAPVLPMSRRWPDRCDGLALVAGSIAPDLAYVTRGWGYGPWSIPLWFDGHRLQNILVVSVFAALLSVVVRRRIMPVLPLALPAGGILHLHDYRYLARHRRAWWVTLGSAFVGVVTHLVLDAFTHEDGSVVIAAGPLQTRLFSVGGRTVHVYTALQYGGTAVLSVYAAWCLVRVGRARLFRPPPAERDRAELPSWVRAAFWVVVAIGCVIGAAYGTTRTGYHVSNGVAPLFNKSVVIISFSWVAFIALLLACLGAEPFVRTSRSEPSMVGVPVAGRG